MREPDKRGAIARAWKSRAKPVRPAQDACLVQWVVHGPFHPFWHYWVVATISLADMPEAPPAFKQYPEAEYELMIVSLNPDSDPPDPDLPESLDFLTPIDLQFHFDGVSDEQALEITEMAIHAIVEGKMSPDQDFRNVWKETLTNTLAHYKQGLH